MIPLGIIISVVGLIFLSIGIFGLPHREKGKPPRTASECNKFFDEFYNNLAKGE